MQQAGRKSGPRPQPALAHCVRVHAEEAPGSFFVAALARRLWALTAVLARPVSGSSRAARAAAAVTSVAPRRQLRLHAGGLAARAQAGRACSFKQVTGRRGGESPFPAQSKLRLTRRRAERPAPAGPWRVARSAPGRGRRHAARGRGLSASALRAWPPRATSPPTKGRAASSTWAPVTVEESWLVGVLRLLQIAAPKSGDLSLGDSKSHSQSATAQGLRICCRHDARRKVPHS